MTKNPQPLTLDMAFTLGYEKAVQEIICYLEPDSAEGVLEVFTGENSSYAIAPDVRKALAKAIQRKFSSRPRVDWHNEDSTGSTATVPTGRPIVAGDSGEGGEAGRYPAVPVDVSDGSQHD